MIFAPKVVYNSITVALTISQRLWTPSSPTVGGSDRATGGARATFLLRRDYLLRTRIRCTEAEWPAVLLWLVWAQAGGVYAWYPDASLGTNISCYMESPLMGEDLTPERGEAVGTYEIDVVHRSAAGTPFDVRAYA